MHLVSLRESCFSVFGGQRPSFPDFLLSHSNNLRLVLLQGCSANRGSRFPQLRFTISQPPAVYWPGKNSYYSSHIQNVLVMIRGVRRSGALVTIFANTYDNSLCQSKLWIWLKFTSCTAKVWSTCCVVDFWLYPVDWLSKSLRFVKLKWHWLMKVLTPYFILLLMLMFQPPLLWLYNSGSFFLWQVVIQLPPLFAGGCPPGCPCQPDLASCLAFLFSCHSSSIPTYGTDWVSDWLMIN